MYTHEMMMKREQLRTDPLVESALTHMWARFDKVRGGEEAISQQTYTAMCRKLYLLFKIQQRDGYLEPADALSEIVRDWPHDTGGKDHMNRHDFDSAWFQLADIHTDDVAVASYCALLHTACDAIMTPDGEWVDDLDLLKQLREACRGKSRKSRKYFDSSAFASTIRGWGDAFEQPDLPTEMGMGTSASASTSARASRRPSSDTLWLPKSVRTRGPDEWDPAVNMVNWLSQRGSGGPPPRLDKPVPKAPADKRLVPLGWPLPRRALVLLRCP